MIPQLVDLGEGYNELEKYQILQKHLDYYKNKSKQVQKRDSGDHIKQIVKQHLQSEINPQEIIEIDNILASLEEEKITLQKRLQTFYDKKNGEAELLSTSLQLIDRLKQLYNDKLTLKQKNNQQQQVISSLLINFYQVNYELTQKVQDLVRYQSQLPNQREIELRQQYDKLKQEVDQLRVVYSQVEYVQNLLLQADETKKMVIELLSRNR
ncbi:hypothetical protein pb186bvf_009924 [Paramecium bursaria]